MVTAEKLEERVQKLKARLQAAAQPSEEAPAHTGPRQVRKRLKRVQRKLRKLKGKGQHEKKKEAAKEKGGAGEKEAAPPAKT
jgi:hypothetical protein